MVELVRTTSQTRFLVPVWQSIADIFWLLSQSRKEDSKAPAKSPESRDSGRLETRFALVLLGKTTMHGLVATDSWPFSPFRAGVGVKKDMYTCNLGSTTHSQ